ncbi:MAG: hypothetical protein AB7Q42_20175 [Acidimicrobiia bacterium]
MEPRHVTIGAGAAIIVGSWGTWMAVRSGFGQIELSGLETDDGKLTAGLGVLVVLAATLMKLSGKGRALVTGLAAAAAGAVAAYDYSDISNRVEEVNSEFIQASVGWGLWLVLIGAIVGVAAAISTWPREKAAVLAEAASSTAPAGECAAIRQVEGSTTLELLDSPAAPE